MHNDPECVWLKEVLFKQESGVRALIIWECINGFMPGAMVPYPGGLMSGCTR